MRVDPLIECFQRFVSSQPFSPLGGHGGVGVEEKEEADQPHRVSIGHLVQLPSESIR